MTSRQGLSKSGAVWWQQPVLILLVYTGLGLTLTLPLVFNLARAVPSDIGDPLLNTWILAWNGHALLTDAANLFNANIYYPLPNTLAFSEHLFSTALLGMPVQLFLAEPVVAYNLSLIFSFVMSAFGMYLLALHWTHQRGPAFIAGLIFGFAPYRFAAIAHLQLLTFQWLPLGLFFLDRLVTNSAPERRRRDVLALIVFLLLQLLASWYLAVYSGLIIAVFLLFHLVLIRQWRTPVVAAVMVLLLVLPFALPYLNQLDDLQAARPLSQALTMAAAPTDYLAAAPFSRITGPMSESFRRRPGFTEENNLFPGLAGLTMAVLAVVLIANRKPTARALRLSLSLLSVLALSIGLTFATPYSLLVNLLPAASLVRVPARWIIPALFAMAGLAALALAQTSSRWRRVIIGAAGFLVLAEAFSVPLPLAEVDNRSTLNPAYSWLAAQSQDFPLVLVELPLHSAPAPEYPEVKRLYASTRGWWQLVNGYSGYTPARQPRLAEELASFPAASAVTALQELAAPQTNDPTANRVGPTLYVLVHPDEAPLDRRQWEETGRWLAERNPWLTPIGQFNESYLYRLRPAVVIPTTSTPLASFGPNRTVQLTDFSVDGCATTEDPCRNVTLFWTTAEPVPVDATVFIHLRAADGFVRGQADGPPVSGHYPTTVWQPGEIVEDIHRLPAVEENGQIDHLAIGLYDPVSGERLPGYGPDGRRLPEDAILVPFP